VFSKNICKSYLSRTQIAGNFFWEIGDSGNVNTIGLHMSMLYFP